MEKILKIQEIEFKLKETDSYYDTYGGYEIVTDQQTIRIGISNDAQCCENFGYVMSEDILTDFIGASLISISSVDEALNKVKIDTDEGDGDRSTSCMFINFETSQGLLQFVAYNTHNGYYGHHAVLISNQLNKSETL
jgi:hypothetical protein